MYWNLVFLKHHWSNRVYIALILAWQYGSVVAKAWGATSGWKWYFNLFMYEPNWLSTVIRSSWCSLNNPVTSGSSISRFTYSDLRQPAVWLLVIVESSDHPPNNNNNIHGELPIKLCLDNHRSSGVYKSASAILRAVSINIFLEPWIVLPNYINNVES